MFLGHGLYPLSLLNPPMTMLEVCGIFCATANPTERVPGAVDGCSPKGTAGRERQQRKDLSQKIGHEL